MAHSVEDADVDEHRAWSLSTSERRQVDDLARFSDQGNVPDALGSLQKPVFRARSTSTTRPFRLWPLQRGLFSFLAPPFSINSSTKKRATHYIPESPCAC